MITRCALPWVVAAILVQPTIAVDHDATQPAGSSSTNLDVSLGVLPPLLQQSSNLAVGLQGTALPWQFAFEAAFWIPIGGSLSNIDVSGGDFDSGAGTMGWIRFDGVSQEGLGIFAEITTLNYEIGSAMPALTADVAHQILDVGPIYRMSVPLGGQAIELDVYGGFRYHSIDYNEVATATFDEDAFEPMIGVKAMNLLTDKLRVEVRGSLSGFGVTDDSTELTWEVRAALGIDVTRLFTIRVGYRGMGVEYDATSVTFTYQTVVHGPFVGGSFQF